jgi:hypothetical protein
MKLPIVSAQSQAQSTTSSIQKFRWVRWHGHLYKRPITTAPKAAILKAAATPATVVKPTTHPNMTGYRWIRWHGHLYKRPIMAAPKAAILNGVTTPAAVVKPTTHPNMTGYKWVRWHGHLYKRPIMAAPKAAILNGVTTPATVVKPMTHPNMTGYIWVRWHGRLYRIRVKAAAKPSTPSMSAAGKQVMAANPVKKAPVHRARRIRHRYLMHPRGHWVFVPYAIPAKGAVIHPPAPKSVTHPSVTPTKKPGG